jgi:hypothetical protein
LENSLFLKIEMLFPEFVSVLLAMVLCALLTARGGLEEKALSGAAALPGTEMPPPEKEPFPLSSEGGEAVETGILEHYRNPETRDEVVNFFAALCGSPGIAAIILANADAFNISPSLAFALCREESRYKPDAVNRKNRNESVDRGLFQLNDRSFPKLEIADFYNPDINARCGLGHLKWCLDTGGTEISALAMYNAGAGRVQSLGAPKLTLDYIYRILEYRKDIEESFAAETSRAREAQLAAQKNGTKSGEFLAIGSGQAEGADSKDSKPRRILPGAMGRVPLTAR